MGLRSRVFVLAACLAGCGTLLGATSDDEAPPGSSTNADASANDARADGVGGDGDTTIPDGGEDASTDAKNDASDAAKDAAGDGGATNPNACNGKPACARLVFVTSKLYPGNFDATTANDKCRAVADASSMTTVRGRLWRAWISTAAKSAQANMVSGNNGYYLVDGSTLVANDFFDLVDGSLQNKINVDELGNVIPGGSAWTATGSNGNYVANGCNGFISIAQSNYAKVGNIDAVDGSWSDSGDLSCAMSARLYCFEY